MIRPIALLGGTGPEGFGLALRWARAGETVIIGSRDANRARESAEKIKQLAGEHAKISGDENTAACRRGGVVVLTIPFEGHAALLKQIKTSIRPGTVVVDTTVPQPPALVDGRPEPWAFGRVRLRKSALNLFPAASRLWRPSRILRRNC